MLLFSLFFSFHFLLTATTHTRLSIHSAEKSVNIKQRVHGICAWQKKREWCKPSGNRPQVDEKQHKQLKVLLMRDKDVFVCELEDREAVKGVVYEIGLESGTKTISISVKCF